MLTGFIAHIVVFSTFSHDLPAAQLEPQPPQWLSFDAMFTALPPQQTCDGFWPHWKPLFRFTHAPIWHVSHWVQLRAQVPQWASEVSGLKHCPPQQRLPAAQLFVQLPHATSEASRFRHVPLQQVLPAAQTLPQVPQFCSSVAVARQTLAQHVWPVPQASPQAPQFCSSAVRSTHAPLQQLWPMGQSVPGVHAPAPLQTSPVHALPSLHGVPATRGGYTHVPVCAEQLPAPKHWPGGGAQMIGAPAQAPAEQVSALVHGLPSLQARALQSLSAQSTCPSQSLSVPSRQLVSVVALPHRQPPSPRQISPFAPQLVPASIAAWTQPVAGLHESTVQLDRSAHITCAPEQPPSAVQRSPPVHALPSLHSAPWQSESAQSASPSQSSSVPLEHVLSAAPPGHAQTPAAQTLPFASHGMPSGAFVTTQPASCVQAPAAHADVGHTVAVPWQVPAVHASLLVQASRSSQVAPAQSPSAQSRSESQSSSTPSLHAVSVAVHETQVAPAHRSPAEHVRPTHTASRHAPATHTWPAGQGVWPHAVATHAPSAHSVPGAHDTPWQRAGWQPFATQAAPSAQSCRSQFC